MTPRQVARAPRGGHLPLPRFGPALAGPAAHAQPACAAGHHHRPAAVPAGDRPAQLPDRRGRRGPRAQAARLRAGAQLPAAPVHRLHAGHERPGNAHRRRSADDELDAAMGLFGRYPGRHRHAVHALPRRRRDRTPWAMPGQPALNESGIGDIRVEGKALLATLGERRRVHLGALGRPDAADGQDAAGRAYLGDKTVTGPDQGASAPPTSGRSAPAPTWAS